MVQLHGANPWDNDIPRPCSTHFVFPFVCIVCIMIGVGRLAFDITALGYSVQGNDFSLFMLLASDFMLNGGIATPENPIMISPFLLETRNVHSTTDPLRIAKIPDVDPYTVLSARVNADENEAKNMPEFSMAAGEKLFSKKPCFLHSTLKK